MISPVTPQDPEWNVWVTLSNDVSGALRRAMPERRLLFSKRNAIAQELWEAGYRPTEEQVQAEVKRQRAYDAVVARVVEP